MCHRHFGRPSYLRLQHLAPNRIYSLFAYGDVLKITPDRVVLGNHYAAIGSFSPLFYGAFLDNDGRALLRGEITISPITRAGVILYFILVISTLVLLPLYFSILESRSPNPSPFVIAFGLMALGIAFVRLCVRLTATDRQNLKRTLSSALKGGP